MFFTVMVVFHVLVSIALIIVVLMQSSKGDGLAGTAFSGGLSGAVFGGRGAASFLSKATTVLAVLFMFNCGALAFMSSQTRQTVDPGQVTDSAVTRKMAEEQERMMQQQAQAQEQALQDSIARAGGQQSDLEDLFNTPDTSGN